MTTTQYTPGTIIAYEDEAHRILQINSKGYARTISDSGDAAAIDINTLDAETIKVIPDANTETWVNYISKARTVRHINKEITRKKYTTEFFNALSSYRTNMTPEVVPTISLLNEATTREAVQTYLENIITSIITGKSALENQYKKFLVAAVEIMENDPTSETSIPAPDAGYTIIKGYKFRIDWLYRFEVRINAEDYEYTGDYENVYRYAKVTRVTKTRAYLTFEDGSEGHVASAGSKSYADLTVAIGEETYPVDGLKEYPTDTLDDIQESVTYAENRAHVAKQISRTYNTLVREVIEVNPFWDNMFSNWGIGGRSAESVMANATKNLSHSINAAAKATGQVTALLDLLTTFDNE